MRKIRIAQIGTSQYSHGSEIFQTMKALPELFEIVGYALPENEREKFLHRMPVFEGYREMTVAEILHDPTIEAVTVETEEVYLTKYAQMVADAKKHMHMEKPGGVDVAAFERMIGTVRENGTVFHTGYMYRYNPYVSELLAQIERGELGRIVSVEAQMSCYHAPEWRQWLEHFPGGMMFFLGCHLIDLIYRIQGEPQCVYALNKCTGLDGVTAKDYGMAVLEYENGVSFAKTTDVERGGFARRQLVVTGEKGTVELKPLEWYVPGSGDLWTGKTVRTSTEWHTEPSREQSAPADRYRAMMQSFAAMVRGEKVNPYSLDYELSLYKLILRACGAL